MVITEGQIRRAVNKAFNNLLNEIDLQTKVNAWRKAKQQGRMAQADNFYNSAVKQFDDDYSYKDRNGKTISFKGETDDKGDFKTWQDMNGIMNLDDEKSLLYQKRYGGGNLIRLKAGQRKRANDGNYFLMQNRDFKRTQY